MQPRGIVYCINSHEAEKLCMDQDCTSPSPICNFQGCQCQKTHKQCLANVHIETILYKLNKRELNKAGDKNSILEAYDSAIKELVRDRDEYLAASSELNYENKFSMLLMSGNPTDIQPKLVNEIAKRLKNQAEGSKSTKDSLLSQQASQTIKELEKAIAELKRSWSQPSESFKFCFSQKLCPGSIFRIHQGGQKIERYAKESGMTSLALLEPSLQSFSNCPKKVQFKILALKNDVYLGMCHLNTVKELGFQFHPELGGGAYVINSKDGTVYAHNSTSTLSFQWRCLAGDVVQIQYDPQKGMIVFINKTNGCRTTGWFTFQAGNPLHLCLGMYYPGTVVEIVNSVCTKE